MVDAQDLGSCGRKAMEVQVLSLALRLRSVQAHYADNN